MFAASSRVVSIWFFGFCVRILGLGLCLVCCECLSHLVVFVLLSLQRGRRVGCIWGGAGVVWHACVELWLRAERSWCVDFVRDRVLFPIGEYEYG